MTAARPFLKWAGGKTSLLSEILPRLPNDIKTYYEPFVGGGAVFFALAQGNRFKRAVLNDVNGTLMSAYDTIRNSPERLITVLKRHAESHGKHYFYAVRSTPTPSRLTEVAKLIYLNKTCFNGLYRVNAKGEFNVPFGDYKNPLICDEANLRAVSNALQRVKLCHMGFTATVENAKPGDAVYFDPPYVPLSATSNFTAYAKEGFGPEAQERLRDTAFALVKRGVHVLLSNSDTPYVRELYGTKSFRIERVEARRSINSKGGKRGKVGELLIRGRT